LDKNYSDIALVSYLGYSS